MPWTDKQMSAAIKAADADLAQLISHFIPVFFQSQARASFESAQGQAAVKDALQKAVAAAEAAK